MWTPKSLKTGQTVFSSIFSDFSDFFFFFTHVDLIRNKKRKSNLDKVIFDGERYFRNTHFEQKVVSFFQCRVIGAERKINGKAGMLALHANKRRENATT